MKTRLSIVGMLLALAGIWSCQQELFQEEMLEPEKETKEEKVDEPTPLKQVFVNALWKSDETRTSVYHDDEARQYSFLWEKGDSISLVEVDPSVTGDIVQSVQSKPLSEPCKTARFSMELSDREAGDHLHYVAYYPAAAMPEGKAAGWDETGSTVKLPLTLPLLQRPETESFDGAADLLVSLQEDLDARPEDFDLTFKRVGTVLKLVVTGLEEGTKIMGGTLDLGYDCSGEILYDAKTRTWSKTETGKQIEFCYATKNDETGEVEGTPLEALNGSATIWLRVLAGKADDWVTLSINTLTLSDKGKIKINTVTRDIDLKRRGATINFKEGGVTTFSATLTSPEVILPSTLTSVPKLYIGAKVSDIKDKTTWITTKATFVNRDDGKVLYEESTATIRGRGNTTWTSFPKKPYYLKFDKKQNLLGKSKSKKYILLANWMDRTNLRNAVAFEAARRTSMEWVPSGMFVELYLNDQYNGLYYLCEKIEVEDGRLNPKTVDYLFTMDMSDTSEWHFKVDYGYRPNHQYADCAFDEIPVEVKHPEAEDNESAEDFKERITADAKPKIEDFAQQIAAKNSAAVANLDSFCDWFLVHSLCTNVEPNHPKSCYMYRKSDGKMYAGPVWDFDWGTFVLGKTGFLIEDCLFYGKNTTYQGFFKDRVFVDNLVARWDALKPEFQTLGAYVDAQAAFIKPVEGANHSKWPIFSGNGGTSVPSAVTANGDQNMSFTNAKNRMKNAIAERITAIDNAVNSLRNAQ